MLFKAYKINFINSAEEALELIKRGHVPSIVICAYQLNGMLGDEFLKSVNAIDKNIIKILLTANENTKELIEIFSNSEADLFIKKPFHSLEFLQIIKKMYALYEQRISIIKFKKAYTNLENEKKTLKAEIEKIKNKKEDDSKSLIKTISALIIEAERFHFLPHTHNVSQIARKLALRMELEDEAQLNLVYASYLANHYKIGLPDRLKLLDPRDLETGALKRKFGYHFKDSLANLYQIQSIKKYVELAGKIFETMDGKGEPMQLSGLEIPKEIQILGLVNLYYHRVYALEEKDLFKLKMEGVIYQSKQKTFDRHRDAITYLYKRLKWFDHDLFYQFQEMLKKRDVTELKFHEKDLKIEYDTSDFATPHFNNDDKEKYLMNKAWEERRMVRILSDEGDIVEEYPEQMIRFEYLKVGMVLSQPIKTYEGTILIGANKTIDQKLYNKIELNHDSENIRNKFFIKMLSEEELEKRDEEEQKKLEEELKKEEEAESENQTE